MHHPGWVQSGRWPAFSGQAEGVGCPTYSLYVGFRLTQPLDTCLFKGKWSWMRNLGRLVRAAAEHLMENLPEFFFA